ncbi:hypothetical protein NKG94_49205 [Micromonospora sp. M12]
MTNSRTSPRVPRRSSVGWSARPTPAHRHPITSTPTRTRTRTRTRTGGPARGRRHRRGPAGRHAGVLGGAVDVLRKLTDEQLDIVPRPRRASRTAPGPSTRSST